MAATATKKKKRDVQAALDYLPTPDTTDPGTAPDLPTRPVAALPPANTTPMAPGPTPPIATSAPPAAPVEVDTSAIGDAPFPGFQYTKPGASETTQLAPAEEQAFQTWVKQNNVPWQDSPTADYDMRGFYKALMAGDPEAKQSLSGYDGKMHFPDTYKTKYHPTFSDESKYATRPNAPHWYDNRLIDEHGNIIADETPPPVPMNTTGGILPGRNGLALVPNRPDLPYQADVRRGAVAPEYAGGMGATRPILTPPATPSVTDPTNVDPNAAAANATAAATAGTKELPTYRGPQDDLAGTLQHLIDFENQKPDHLSRKRAMAAGALRGLGLGLQSGSLGAGIGAAATGAAVGFAAPGRQAKMEHDAKVAEEYAKVGRRVKTAATIAALRHTQAQTDELAGRPGIAAANRASAAETKMISNILTLHGRLGHFSLDPNDKDSQALLKLARQYHAEDLLVPYTKATAAKNPPRVTKNGVTYERQDDGSWAAAKGLPGETTWDTEVSPGVIVPLNAGQRANFEAQRSNREGIESRDTEAQNKAKLKEFTANQKTADTYYGAWAAAHNDFVNAQNAYNNMERPQTDDLETGQKRPMTDAEFDALPDRQRAKLDMEDAKKSMNDAIGRLAPYSDFYEISRDELGPVANPLHPSPPVPTSLPGRRSGKQGNAGAVTPVGTTNASGGVYGKDGKWHYSMSTIQKKIDPKTGLTKGGQRLEELLSAVRANKDTAIDDDTK